MTGESPVGPRDARSLAATLGAVNPLIVAATWAVALVMIWGLVIEPGPRGPTGWLGFDSYAYWLAARRPEPYLALDLPGLDEQFGRFLYPPVFLQLIWPLAQLPWDLFSVLWSGMAAGVFIWLLRPLPWAWAVPAFVILCLEEVILGNARSLISLALVFALGRPLLWAVPVLTKVATGVGVLWHPFRREWGRAATALLTSATLIGLSVALDPKLWRDWLAYLMGSDVDPNDGWIGLTLRWALAVGIVLVAARRGSAWWLPAATALASPVIYIADLSYLAAVPRMLPGDCVAVSTRDGFGDKPEGIDRA